MRRTPIWTYWLLGISSFYVVTSVLPAWKTDAWWVRVMDHPRAQLAALGIVCFALLGGVPARRWGKRSTARFVLLPLVVTGLALDAHRVIPYTPLARKESPVEKAGGGEQLIFFAANVLQTNTRYSDLSPLIEREDPDIIFLTETDAAWVEAMKHLEKEYPHRIAAPLDNTYGLAFYSRYPVRNLRVNYLIESDVPSVHGYVRLPSGAEVEFYGLHPKPPVPQVGDSAERDGELLLVARRARESRLPLVVLGDLNDVAWSHTTRLFLRESGLLDPRRGRGTYATFPASPPLFPIDHVFHSEGLKLRRIDVLDRFGSDHRPLVAAYGVEPAQEAKHSSADASDQLETQQSIRKAKKEERETPGGTESL